MLGLLVPVAEWLLNGMYRRVNLRIPQIANPYYKHLSPKSLGAFSLDSEIFT